jgi:hypothetical protein
VWPVIRLLSGSLIGALRDVPGCLVGVGLGEAAVGGSGGACALLALILIVGDILTVSIPAQVVYFSLAH